MSIPPLPPRPSQDGARNSQPANQPPPVLPPLPPELLAQPRSLPSPYPPPSLPHFDPPLAAPRAHRVDPSLPANVRLVSFRDLAFGKLIGVMPFYYINRWPEPSTTQSTSLQTDSLLPQAYKHTPSSILAPWVDSSIPHRSRPIEPHCHTLIPGTHRPVLRNNSHSRRLNAIHHRSFHNPPCRYPWPR